MPIIQPVPQFARINPSHWAAKGLVGCWLLNARGYHHHGQTRRSGFGEYAMISGTDPGILSTEFGPLQKWVGDGVAGNRSYLGIPYNSDVALGGASKATFVGWMNVTADGVVSYNYQGRVMDADGGTGNNDHGWTIQIHDEDAAVKHLRFNGNATTGTWSVNSGDNFYSLNEWMRFVVTLDGQEVKFYKNGGLFGTAAAYTGGTINDNGGLDLGIGARPKAGEWARNFEGFLLDLRVYKDTKWSVAQIALDYRDTFGLYRQQRRVFKAGAAAAAYIPYPRPRGSRAGMGELVGGRY